jgi:hypothetical protein
MNLSAGGALHRLENAGMKVGRYKRVSENEAAFNKIST